MICSYARMTTWCAMLALTLAPISMAGAGSPPAYRYGQAWWQEYSSDDGTSVLIHFGQPEPIKWRVAAVQTQKQREERSRSDDPFAEIGPAGSRSTKSGSGPELMDAAAIKDRRAAPPTAEAPPGKVLDYANGVAVSLPVGATIISDGRFGQAICFAGGEPLRAQAAFARGEGQSMECWFRVAKLPKAVASILSINRDEGRVVLLPDGRIELLRRLPHGEISSKLSPQQRAEIESRDARLVSRVPIRPGEWTHVCVFTEFPSIQGETPSAPTLKINGEDVASYLTEPGNTYNFMGRGAHAGELCIGNSAKGDEPFEGVIDEVRVSHVSRDFYTRPPMPWRESLMSRPIAVGKPTLRRNGLVFHAPLDQGVAYTVSRTPSACVTMPEGLRAEAIGTPAVRASGWTIDPIGGFPRFDLRGMNAKAGTLELWLRPVNWDNYTGYWVHSPPVRPQLSVVRCYGKDRRDGQIKLFINATLPRANNLERKRLEVDPGHWSHLLIVWPGTDLQRAYIYRNGEWMSRIWRADPDTLANIDPVYAEIGVNDDVTVARGELPVIEIDEIFGYDYDLQDDDERRQAFHRWLGPVEPLRPFDARVTYKASIGTLELAVTPKLPDGQSASRVEARLMAGSEAIEPPKSVAASGERGGLTLVLRDRKPLKPGAYRIALRIEDSQGKPAVEDSIDWRFAPEPWRDNRIGVLDKAPPPWTAIRVEGNSLATRMTRYQLGDDGLPQQIVADGCDLLAAPVSLLEAGEAMKSGGWKLERANEVAVSWKTRLFGKTCDVDAFFTIEYDGMLRCEWRIMPKGDRVERLSVSIPLQAVHAGRFFWNEAGASGVRTGVTPSTDGVFLSSRRPGFWVAEARARRENQPLPTIDKWSSYAFLTQIDFNDLDRGLYWFADNAAGWAQSKVVDAQEVLRRGEVIELRCNIVAERTEGKFEMPIVFGLLPHPARPMPEKYRLMERVAPEFDSAMSSVFDAFRPWPRDPRGDRGNMNLFPAPDPDKPGDWRASWAAAEAALPAMRLSKPTGLRTMYLSNYWFGCRAGAYDHWEWRNGPTHQVTHSQSFVDYSCWEIDQWIGRGIWEAVYLDECYEAPSISVESGQAVRLPDGTVQPGITLFGFRQMMQRWRNIFQQHGKHPVILAHHTGSFMYAGLVFCDAFLDGENRPIITPRSGDFIDQVQRDRVEALQNGKLWGLASFYMPCIWEGGFENKQANPHKRWAWRMARGVQALLAHHEVGYTYPGQGAEVYTGYWNDVLRWGAGDIKVPFHPYWNNGRVIQVDGQGQDTLVSCYQQPGRVLVIASNLTQEPRNVRIALNTANLGLGKSLRAEPYDTGWLPAKGDDVERGKPKDIESLEGVGFDGRKAVPGEFSLDEEKEDKPTLRVDENVVIATVRARDFLMFVVADRP